MPNDMLKVSIQKLYGLPPYNAPDNICYGDGFFAKAIESHYSKEEIDTMKQDLGIK